MDWKNFFDRLGLNGVAWQWRIIRWQNAWENRKAQWQEGRRQVVYRHKVCPHCGALVDRHDATCMRCGTAVGSWRGQVLLHRKEIRRIIAQMTQQGHALIPLRLYLKHGLIKVELALCRGKQAEDKRETLRRKTAEREAARAMASRTRR